MREITVEVIRKFEPLLSRTGYWDSRYFVPGKPRGWHEIENERRVLILADPGAGKTFEALTRAYELHDRGKKAFFIRIEAIDATFGKAFEVGTDEEFLAWLKTLYILMHRYIRAADDIERAGTGVYSPTLRDHAQDARDRLFNLLAAVPGNEAYTAIKALEDEHPDPAYRRWMARRARERATLDADEPPWAVRQVRDFIREIAGP